MEVIAAVIVILEVGKDPCNLGIPIDIPKEDSLW